MIKFNYCHLMLMVKLNDGFICVCFNVSSFIMLLKTTAESLIKKIKFLNF